MENLEKYYTDIDRELLELAAYFKNAFLKVKENGALSEGDEQSLAEINDIPNKVNHGARRRMDNENENIKNKEKLWKERTLVFCFNCNEVRNVSIKAERKNPKTGWKCDLVKCSVCKQQFVAPIPNNQADAKKFYEDFIEQILTVREDGETHAEKFAGVVDSNAAIESFRAYIQAIENEELAIKNWEISTKKVDDVIENLRDILLKAKLSKVNWHNNVGLA